MFSFFVSYELDISIVIVEHFCMSILHTRSNSLLCKSVFTVFVSQTNNMNEKVPEKEEILDMLEEDIMTKIIWNRKMNMIDSNLEYITFEHYLSDDEVPRLIKNEKFGSPSQKKQRSNKQ